MELTSLKDSPLFGFLLGLFLGVLFTVILGSLDMSDYLVEQLSIGFVELPFIVFWAVFEKKYGWKNAFSYVLIGTVVSLLLSFQLKSITPMVYFKVSIIGIILGEATLFAGSFTKRFAAVSFPGVLLAFVFGIPLIFADVSPDVIERIRADALRMYQTFMSPEEALNAADNAMIMFRGIFKVSFAVFFISAIGFAWLSFLVTPFFMRKFKEEPEYVAPFNSFKLPFHAVWLFLAGFGILLSEYKPVFPLALNVFAVMACLYLLQGMAIVMYHINRFSMGRVLKVVFWLLFFISLGFTGGFLILTGVIDNWFNLRSMPSHRDENCL